MQVTTALAFPTGQADNGFHIDIAAQPAMLIKPRFSVSAEIRAFGLSVAGTAGLEPASACAITNRVLCPFELRPRRFGHPQLALKDAQPLRAIWCDLSLIVASHRLTFLGAYASLQGA